MFFLLLPIYLIYLNPLHHFYLLFLKIVDEAYDRLDDSRPLTEVRPQYLRIASGSLGSLGGLGTAGNLSAAVSPNSASATSAQEQTSALSSVTSSPSSPSSQHQRSSSTLSLDSAKIWKIKKKSARNQNEKKFKIWGFFSHFNFGQNYPIWVF